MAAAGTRAPCVVGLHTHFPSDAAARVITDTHTHTHTHTITMRFKLSEPVNNLPSHGTKGTRHSSSPLTPPALVPLRHARAQGAADLGHVNPKPSNQNPKTEARDLWRSALQGLRLSEA